MIKEKKLKNLVAIIVPLYVICLIVVPIIVSRFTKEQISIIISPYIVLGVIILSYIVIDILIKNKGKKKSGKNKKMKRDRISKITEYDRQKKIQMIKEKYNIKGRPSKCEHCGAEINIMADDFCKYCGTKNKLYIEFENSIKAHQSKIGRLYICQACGYDHKKIVKFCEKCGYELRK